jgi:hypothetical protein
LEGAKRTRRRVSSVACALPGRWWLVVIEAAS